MTPSRRNCKKKRRKFSVLLRASKRALVHRYWDPKRSSFSPKSPIRCETLLIGSACEDDSCRKCWSITSGPEINAHHSLMHALAKRNLKTNTAYVDISRNVGLFISRINCSLRTKYKCTF